MHPLESFSEALKAYRRNYGLTQSELADQLNFSTETISSWERRRRKPNIQQIPHLARLLNVTVEELLQLLNEENGLQNGLKSQEPAIDVLEQNSMIRVFSNQEECEPYIREAARSAEKVKILTIRGEKYFLGPKSLLHDLFSPRRSKEPTIEVLVLSPRAQHITEELADKIHHNTTEEIREKMRFAFDYLKMLLRRNPNLAVKSYNEKPNFKILMFDSVMFVSSFAIEQPKNDHNAPMFQMMREGNPLFYGFERYFDSLSERSVPIQENP